MRNTTHTADIPAICDRLIDVCAPKSIRIQLEIRQTTDTGEGKAFEFPIKQEWAATSSGQRYFDDWFMPPSDMAFDHRSVYSDGHKFAHVWFLQQDPTRQYEISYNRDELLERRDFFLDAPEPIRFTHVGLIPLHEALPTAEIMPAAEVIGRGCDVFHFSKAGKPSDPASLVYYLDTETAYPLKVVIYNNLDRFRARAPDAVWEAKTFDKVSGRHFLPLSSTYSIYRTVDLGDGKSESKLTVFQTIRIVHAEFDAVIPSSTFWPASQPGVRIIDKISTRSSPVLGRDLGIPKTAQAANPIRADIPRSSGALLTATGVALSAAVLLIAALLWKRAK